MLEILPSQMNDAAGHMALDYLLFQWMGKVEKGTGPARLRRFLWRDRAVTFGFSQKWSAVQKEMEEMPGGGPHDICRRFTGGGVVPHGMDVTWALFLPKRLELVEQPAPEIYCALHRVLCAVIGREEVVLWSGEKVCGSHEKKGRGPRPQCFSGPEPGDLIWEQTGQKVAGAAMKRGKQGLLWEGSLQASLWGPVDEEKLTADFAAGVADLLGEEAQEKGFPDWDPGAEDEVANSLRDDSWNQRR